MGTELVMRALSALQVEPGTGGFRGTQESAGSHGNHVTEVDEEAREVVDLTVGESTPEKTETLLCDKPGEKVLSLYSVSSSPFTALLPRLS